MVPQATLLVLLVRLVDRIPTPPAPVKRGRGRPPTYSDRLFLKALVIMIVKHLHSPYELLCVLEQPGAEMLRCGACCGSRVVILPAVPGRAAWLPCPIDCPRRSAAWVPIWSP